MIKFFLLAGIFYASFGVAGHFGVAAGHWLPFALLGFGLFLSGFGVWGDLDAHIKKLIRREVMEILAEEKEEADALSEQRS